LDPHLKNWPKGFGAMHDFIQGCGGGGYYRVKLKRWSRDLAKMNSKIEFMPAFVAKINIKIEYIFATSIKAKIGKSRKSNQTVSSTYFQHQ
jgi:hypothetical protein